MLLLQNLRWRFSPLFIAAIATLIAITMPTVWDMATAQVSPPIAQALFPSQSGNMVYTPVRLDGRILFPIAAESSTGQGMAPNSTTPIESRAQVIENTLYKILQRGFNADKLNINSTINERHAEISLSDGQQYDNLPLLVLTDMDARISGFTLPEFAEHAARTIQKTLIAAQKERQADFLKQQGLASVGIVAVASCTSLILYLIRKRLMVRWKLLKEKQKEQEQKLMAANAAIDTDEEESNSQASHCCAMMSQQIDYGRLLNRYDLYGHLISLGFVLVWLISTAWIVGLFPYTRWLQAFAIQQPIVLVVLLGTNLAIKYSGVVIDRLLAKWASRESLTFEATQRWTLRISSFSPIIKGIVAIHLAGLSLLYILYAFGIPLGPILAGAGILGFAISLGAQTLVKDLIAGALILVEDQYAIGDFVILNGNDGRVERMNLRTTSLRSDRGNLITIPNSEIRVVHNLSKDWARAKLAIYIDYNTDLEYAISVIQSIIDDLAIDPFWQTQIIAAEVRGVEDIDAGGFTIGVRFETKPGIYRKAIREYRRRLKPAFDRAGIQLGKSLTSVINKSELGSQNLETNLTMSYNSHNAT